MRRLKNLDLRGLIILKYLISIHNKTLAVIIQVSYVAWLEIIFYARYSPLIARTMRLLDQWTHSNKIKLETTATYISRLIALI